MLCGSFTSCTAAVRFWKKCELFLRKDTFQIWPLEASPKTLAWVFCFFFFFLSDFKNSLRRPGGFLLRNLKCQRLRKTRKKNIISSWRYYFAFCIFWFFLNFLKYSILIFIGSISLFAQDTRAFAFKNVRNE